MFCPRCGEERISEETSFCSKCGYLLTGTAELLDKGGALVPADDAVRAAWWSPRSHGIRMGLFMLLLTIVLAPIVGIISVFALNTEPWPVGVVIFLLGGGGLLRIVYALMFETKKAHLLPGEGWPKAGVVGAAAATTEPQLSGPGSKGELYPSSFIPPPSSRWLDTNDLEPTSVTDHTTKLLEKDS